MIDCLTRLGSCCVIGGKQSRTDAESGMKEFVVDGLFSSESAPPGRGYPDTVGHPLTQEENGKEAGT